jgi:hypothetical protein
MKNVLVATIIALMTVTAYAQGMGRGGKHRQGQEKSQSHKKKAGDANAKSPLEQLPDRPYDPWGVVRAPASVPK